MFAVAERFSSYPIPTAGTEALPLQQHAEQGRVQSCGGCPQCEIKSKIDKKMFVRKLTWMGECFDKIINPIFL